MRRTEILATGACLPCEEEWLVLPQSLYSEEKPKMANLITGLFDTEAAAESAVSQLKQLGYGQNEITIVMKDRGAADNLAHDTGSRTMEGVGAGAAVGGTLGAVLAGLLAVGSVAIPGVGLLAAGPLAALL